MKMSADRYYTIWDRCLEQTVKEDGGVVMFDNAKEALLFAEERFGADNVHYYDIIYHKL